MPQQAKRAVRRGPRLRECSARALAALRPLLPVLRRSEPISAEQLTRAATNVALEIVSAEQGEPRARRRHLLSAVASVSEALTLLRLVVNAGGCNWKSARPSYAALSALYLALLKCAGRKGRARSRGAREAGRPAA